MNGTCSKLRQAASVAARVFAFSMFVFSIVPVSLNNSAFGAEVSPPKASAENAAAFSASERSEIEQIIRNYLLQHPEVVQDALGVLEKRQQEAEAQRRLSAVKDNSAAIFGSPHQVVLGNRDGDVTMVEFFDYNCPYCKHALADMIDLLKTDAKLKVVLKEFPVLGQGSSEAAAIAVAVRMQDATGTKYLEFHKKLLGGRGQANRARALAVAQEIGLDMARLERDASGPEVKATIEENLKLAERLGINGTPSYVIGNEVVVGAAGLEALKAKIKSARQ